jgi:hypothetical protein
MDSHTGSAGTDDCVVPLSSSPGRMSQVSSGFMMSVMFVDEIQVETMLGRDFSIVSCALASARCRSRGFATCLSGSNSEFVVEMLLVILFRLVQVGNPPKFLAICIVTPANPVIIQTRGSLSQKLNWLIRSLPLDKWPLRSKSRSLKTEPASP